MLQPGDKAPDFDLLDQNENRVTLSDARRAQGARVLLSEG